MKVDSSDSFKQSNHKQSKHRDHLLALSFSLFSLSFLFLKSKHVFHLNHISFFFSFPIPFFPVITFFFPRRLSCFLWLSFPTLSSFLSFLSFLPFLSFLSFLSFLFFLSFLSYLSLLPFTYSFSLFSLFCYSLFSLSLFSLNFLPLSHSLSFSLSSLVEVH